MHRHRSLAAVLLGAALLSSCDLFGNDKGLRDITAPTVPTSRVKFHNFSPGSVGVNFYANDVKITGVLTSNCANPTTAADSTACNTVGKESTTGIAYPTSATSDAGTASGSRYAAIAPGQYTLAAKVAAQDVVVATAAQAIADGKYYSFFMSGVYDATKKLAEAFVVEDPIPAGPVDYSVASVRLVNAISNGTGPLTLYVTNVETKTETVIGSAVAYKSAGAFVSVPAGTYNLAVRYSGSTTNLISRTGMSMVGGGVYTVTSRGSTATSSTLGLNFTENQR